MTREKDIWYVRSAIEDEGMALKIRTRAEDRPDGYEELA